MLPVRAGLRARNPLAQIASRPKGNPRFCCTVESSDASPASPANIVNQASTTEAVHGPARGSEESGHGRARVALHRDRGRRAALRAGVGEAARHRHRWHHYGRCHRARRVFLRTRRGRGPVRAGEPGPVISAAKSPPGGSAMAMPLPSSALGWLYSAAACSDRWIAEPFWPRRCHRCCSPWRARLLPLPPRRAPARQTRYPGRAIANACSTG